MFASTSQDGPHRGLTTGPGDIDLQQQEANIVNAFSAAVSLRRGTPVDGATARKWALEARGFSFNKKYPGNDWEGESRLF